jgi:hypothetical protein
MYNGARSRDRSHYESFVAYHSALYRRVESTSVTPFSARARDRGLHAVVVAMARLLVPSLTANASAVSVREHLPQLEKLMEQVVRRVESVMPEESEATAAQITAILSLWVQRAQSGLLSYSNFRDPAAALLRNAADAGVDDSFSTLWSMRDVDQESHLFYIP